jgi:protease-4
LGRKGWAIIIISSLLVLTVATMLFKADELGSTGTKNSWEENVVEGAGEVKIAQLFVEGVISETASFTSTFTAESFLSQLDQAKDDAGVKAVVIRVNSPGGEVVASDDIYQKIREVQAAGKPVIVSMGAIAASGGYYIAAPADFIFANPSTLTGSLGVIFSLPNYQEAADKIGYREIHIQSGKFKDIGNPLKELSPAEREIFQSLVQESYNQFVNVIAEGRQMDKEKVLKIADGRIYSGAQAKELNLIDDFGSLEDATEYAMKQVGAEEAQIVRYSEPFTLAALFSGQYSSGQDAASLRLLDRVLPNTQAEPKLLYIFQR